MCIYTQINHHHNTISNQIRPYTQLMYRPKMITFPENDTFVKFAMVMVFNATFNNITIISWWSVLLVGETGVPGEIDRSAASH